MSSSRKKAGNTTSSPNRWMISADGAVSAPSSVPSTHAGNWTSVAPIIFSRSYLPLPSCANAHEASTIACPSNARLKELRETVYRLLVATDQV